jgi:transposase InsO family protein
MGFWTSWFPFSLAQCWPFCWWLAVVIDHWSRRSLGLAAFKRPPTADEICIVLDEAARRAGGVPKYTVSDQGSEFGEEYLEWCDDQDVRAQFGAVGRHGSIAPWPMKTAYQPEQPEIHLCECGPFKEIAAISHCKDHWTYV